MRTWSKLALKPQLVAPFTTYSPRHAMATDHIASTLELPAGAVNSHVDRETLRIRIYSDIAHPHFHLCMRIRAYLQAQVVQVVIGLHGLHQPRLRDVHVERQHPVPCATYASFRLHCRSAWRFKPLTKASTGQKIAWLHQQAVSGCLITDGAAQRRSRCKGIEMPAALRGPCLADVVSAPVKLSDAIRHRVWMTPSSPTARWKR